MPSSRPSKAPKQVRNILPSTRQKLKLEQSVMVSDSEDEFGDDPEFEKMVSGIPGMVEVEVLDTVRV
jgi:hypothetical protein